MAFPTQYRVFYRHRWRKVVTKQAEAIHSKCRVAHFLLARLSGPQCGTTGAKYISWVKAPLLKCHLDHFQCTCVSGPWCGEVQSHTVAKESQQWGMPTFWKQAWISWLLHIDASRSTLAQGTLRKSYTAYWGNPACSQ